MISSINFKYDNSLQLPNFPKSIDIESTDAFTNKSFKTNITSAKMRHLPYYTLAVVQPEGSDSYEFLDGVHKFYASKQAGGQSEKVYYFVLPLFQIDAQKICKETTEDSLAFQYFDISYFSKEQIDALIDGTNYSLEDDDHIRTAQFTISQIMQSKEDALTWLWCATFSKNPEFKAELMNECLKIPSLREEANKILNELKNIPEDQLTERTNSLKKIAELSFKQRSRRSNVN